MAWRIDWEGEVYRETDLTLGQTRRIEQLTSATWLTIAPLRSADQAIAILQVCMADRLGISMEEAEKRVEAIKADEFINAIRNEDDDEQMELPAIYEEGLPKAKGGPSTD